jgi:hypothetical protein
MQLRNKPEKTTEEWNRLSLTPRPLATKMVEKPKVSQITSTDN